VKENKDEERGRRNSGRKGTVMEKGKGSKKEEKKKWDNAHSVNITYCRHRDGQPRNASYKTTD
jgi:hypothetical protein